MAISYNTNNTTAANTSIFIYDENVNGNWNNINTNDGTYTIPDHQHEKQWNGVITIGDMGVESEKYNALEEITLNLIIELFKCNVKQAEELIKDILEEKLEPRKKTKEWIDPKLFEI